MVRSDGNGYCSVLIRISRKIIEVVGGEFFLGEVINSRKRKRFFRVRKAAVNLVGVFVFSKLLM